MPVHRKFTVLSSFYDQHYAFSNSHLPREERRNYSFMLLNPHSGFNLENLSAFLGLWKHKASRHRERYYARFLWQRGWQAGREGGIWIWNSSIVGVIFPPVQKIWAFSVTCPVLPFSQHFSLSEYINSWFTSRKPDNIHVKSFIRVRVKRLRKLLTASFFMSSESSTVREDCMCTCSIASVVSDSLQHYEP